MRDVAVRAGVSLKTVSRVINGEAGVAVATATKVGEAIAELGFRRNDLARSLRQGRTSSTLGLVIEDVANPFYSAIAQAVEAEARQRGYMVITGSCEEDPERERELVGALLRRRVDALLLVPASREHSYLLRELVDGTPIVFLDRPPEGLEADCVLLDNIGGARAATEHLLAQGHERIALVAGPRELYTAGARLAGYREALQAAGLPYDDELVRVGSHDAAQAEAAVLDLLTLPADRRPTALFTGNNRNTVGALRALRAAHEPDAVPRAGNGSSAAGAGSGSSAAGAGSGSSAPIALVGFDDFELAELLVVPTTVIRHDSHLMGRHAATLAFERLDGVDRPPRTVVVPTELVARGSGEVPPP
jgi:LacI family transcriptional regulator